MSTDRSSTTLTDEQAARLERLAARRAPQPARSAADQGPRSTDTADRMERSTVRQSAPRSEGGRSPARKRRRHPAKGSRIAALALSIVTTGGLTAVFTANNVTASFAQTSAVVAAAPGSTQASNPASAPAAASSPPLPSNSAAASTTTAAPTTTVAATPTVVTGGSFANRFGAVQVQATFAPDGSLADVAVLQAPDGDRRSARISEIVVPMLNNEALTVQSGSVDTVSGATYTSRSYEQSLQSAIDAARAQGITSIA